MLARTPEPAAVQMTRRDLGRLLLLSVLLAAAMSIILGLDVMPAQTSLEPGKPAPFNVYAIRTDQYVSDVLTDEARQAARDAVLPQYDYSIARGASVAAQQLREFENKVAPIDAAFADGVTDELRATLLGEVLPGELSKDVRETLAGLDAKRWDAVRSEASRVLDTVERPELHDTEVSTIRDGIANRFAGDLSGPEITLGAALIRPLV